MNDSDTSPTGIAQPAVTPPSPPSSVKGLWKPVLTLLLLAPAVGELLSGSSPPLQFFNPVFLLLLVGLYGCGALLVRETAAHYRLNAAGILLLGAAYGIIEEGLMCKSFFNPYWTDTGFLSVYGRAWGVNWVWAFGLTFYHMAISIAVPIFLTEALFSQQAEAPWLRRRGRVIAGAAFGLVVALGFAVFDNRQFHLIEMNRPLLLAQKLDAPSDPLSRFMAGRLTAKNRDLVHRAVISLTDSPELRHALQEELNRLLVSPDLYSPERFSGTAAPESLKRQAEKRPHGDKLVALNRSLLEAAFPGTLPARPVYPFRPGWLLTLPCVAVVLGLVWLGLRQTGAQNSALRLRKPWLKGLGFTAGFVVIGFLLPSLAEHGVRIPPVLLCLVWCGLACLLGIVLKGMDGAADRHWRRGLWAIGAITPWVFFAMLLGIVVGMMGAKSFIGMPFVSLAFGLAVLALAVRWKRRLGPQT